mmetsp:Transcript_13257/g.36398  ORF Transcript_13257/g.36398 Transcript_13257/m.36398 type:complete len:370 (-) Transcript_13257:7-1116(-)
MHAPIFIHIGLSGPSKCPSENWHHVPCERLDVVLFCLLVAQAGFASEQERQGGVVRGRWIVGRAVAEPEEGEQLLGHAHRPSPRGSGVAVLQHPPLAALHLLHRLGANPLRVPVPVGRSQPLKPRQSPDEPVEQHPTERLQIVLRLPLDHVGGSYRAPLRTPDVALHLGTAWVLLGKLEVDEVECQLGAADRVPRSPHEDVSGRDVTVDEASIMEAHEAPDNHSAYDAEREPPEPNRAGVDALEEVGQRRAQELRHEVRLPLVRAPRQHPRYAEGVPVRLLRDLPHGRHLVHRRGPLQGDASAVGLLAQVAPGALEALTDLPADRDAPDLQVGPLSRVVLNHGCSGEGALEPLEGVAYQLEHPVEVTGS